MEKIKKIFYLQCACNNCKIELKFGKKKNQFNVCKTHGIWIGSSTTFGGRKCKKCKKRFCDICKCNCTFFLLEH